MSESTAPAQGSASTRAELLWPTRPGPGALIRAASLVLAGVCLLTVSAKVQVPGPVPMTLQTLVVLGLGATLGARLAVAAVGLYLLEGALGLPVFAGTPPLPGGLPYLHGPTGGFLVGFIVAAAIVGTAADLGLVRRRAAFGLVLTLASAALVALGWIWLALGARMPAGFGGIGAARAFAVGVAPFLLGEAIKVAIAALSLPLLLDGAERLARR